MTLIANVKWYINWEEWGVIESIPLCSYEELIAAGYSTVAVNELNNYPEAYYNKMVADWHIYTQQAWVYVPFCDYDWYFLSADWSSIYYWRDYHGDSDIIYYDIILNVWNSASGSISGSCQPPIPDPE